MSAAGKKMSLPQATMLVAGNMIGTGVFLLPVNLAQVGSISIFGWVIATIGVAAPIVIYFAMGDKADAILDDLKGWMASNNAAIMAVILVIIGVKLIGDSISGFSA